MFSQTRSIVEIPHILQTNQTVLYRRYIAFRRLTLDPHKSNLKTLFLERCKLLNKKTALKAISKMEDTLFLNP
jgi:hypothetical protein